MNYETSIDGRADAASMLQADGAEGSASRKRMVWIALAVLVAMVAIWFLTHRGDSAELKDDSASQVPVVSVFTPGRATIAGSINATGSLAARREMPVGSVGEGGQVVAVLVEPGQWVRQGQVLAVVDRSVQVQQQSGQAAQIQVAQADARLAQANLDRAQQLVAKGFVSKADIDRLSATRDSANARVRVAQATLGQLRASSARLNILAPAAGLLLERKVEPGQVVGAGSGVLFRIAKGGEMELLAQLGETDLAQVSAGVSVEVTPAGTQKSFAGQIWQIAPVIDPQSRQGIARVALAYAPELRPGGFATARILAGTVVAPMLPESAILSDAKGSFVYIVGKDNKVERRDITTGLVTGGGIAVTAGLSGTEQVVMRAGGFLTPGEKVKPNPVQFVAAS